MKLSKTLVAAAAVAALALSSAPALAGAWLTAGMPSLPAASVTGAETLPLDMNTSAGAQQQALTTGNLKTYANGGAIVTGTSASGAVTANGERVFITTESLTTAAGAVFTETLTDSSVAASSVVLCSVGNGTNSAGTPALANITPASGSAVIKVQNIHASAALNGTLTIACRISS